MIKSTKQKSYGGLSMVPNKSTTNKRSFKHLTQYEYVSRFFRYGFYTNNFGTLFLYSQNNHRLWYRINAKMVLWAGVLKDVKSKFWRPACCPPPLTLLLSVLGDRRRFANKTAFRALLCPMLTRT